jgi:hypothetical protein
VTADLHGWAMTANAARRTSVGGWPSISATGTRQVRGSTPLPTVAGGRRLRDGASASSACWSSQNAAVRSVPSPLSRSATSFQKARGRRKFAGVRSGVGPEEGVAIGDACQPFRPPWDGAGAGEMAPVQASAAVVLEARTGLRRRLRQCRSL